MRASIVQFVSSALLFLASTSTAQSSAGPTPPPRVEREQRDYVEVYLQAKQREFEASERAVGARNLSAYSTAIYNLLREKKSFVSFDVRGKDPAQKQQVRDALERSVAYFLAGIGLTPDQINRLQRSGLDPLQSASNLIGSTPSLEDALTISPIAVVAEVTSSNPTGSNEIERQLSFAARRTLKGSLEQPFSMTLRMPAPPSNAEPGSQYLLFLSEQLAPFQQAAGRQGGGAFTWVSLPYEVENGSYVPISPGQDPRARSTTEIDAFIARHQAAFQAQ